jgi:alanine transaminase
VQHEHEFDEVLFCNIGNPQAVGQAPLTFYREVLGLVDAPSFLNRPDAEQIFGKHVVERARDIASMVGIGTGAYTDTKGVLGIRKNVAKFLLERDGYPAEVDDIYLINGASSGISLLMNTILSGEKDGVLVPTPQYPIYSALITLCGANRLSYMLDESKGWALDAPALRTTIHDARKRGIDPRIMVVINPGMYL